MHQKILDTLNNEYPIFFDHIELHRDMIGYVCFVWSGDKKYVLKLFKENHTKQAMQSIDIMTYLYETGYPTAGIIKTSGSTSYFMFDNEGKSRIGVLYEYINGIEPDKENDIEYIGWQTGKLHKLMSKFSAELTSHSKEYFIDRYINLLSKMKYPGAEKFRELGEKLWKKVNNLPKGFCHGDYHTGNMLLNGKGKYVLYDFDAAAMAFPVYDIAVVCDMTDYFTFDEGKYAKTAQILSRFLKGYEEHLFICKEERTSIYDFIAIRHFEVQATVIENLGLSCVNEKFLDDQYQWLIQWDKQCISIS